VTGAVPIIIYDFVRPEIVSPAPPLVRPPGLSVTSILSGVWQHPFFFDSSGPQPGRYAFSRGMGCDAPNCSPQTSLQQGSSRRGQPAVGRPRVQENAGSPVSSFPSGQAGTFRALAGPSAIFEPGRENWLGGPTEKIPASLSLGALRAGESCGP